MKRLPQFDYLTKYGEAARAATDIPDDAEIVNITDDFENGGPIVISYTRRTSEEEKIRNRQKLQEAINYALDAIAEKCKTEEGYLEKLMNSLEMTAEEQAPFLKYTVRSTK